MNENNGMGLGKNIAEMRSRRDLTQRDLAKMLGISQSHVAKWETEKTQPRSKALEDIAEALDVSVEELLAGGNAGLEQAINIQDQELLELLRELQNLKNEELDALKVLLRGLLSRSRLEQVLQR